MKNKQRKRLQKQINKNIREMNLNIQKDSLWKGRFEARQVDANYYAFSDGSGGSMIVQIRCYDKHTKYYRDYIIDTFTDSHFLDYDIFKMMNTFITEDAKVWSQMLDPRDKAYTALDFTNVKIPEAVMKLPYNINEYKGE